MASFVFVCVCVCVCVCVFPCFPNQATIGLICVENLSHVQVDYFWHFFKIQPNPHQNKTESENSLRQTFSVNFYENVYVQLDNHNRFCFVVRIIDGY